MIKNTLYHWLWTVFYYELLFNGYTQVLISKEWPRVKIEVLSSRDRYQACRMTEKPTRGVGVPRVAHLIEYPGAEEGLREVVDNEHVAQLERLAVGHEPRPDQFGGERIDEARRHRRPRRRHHRPLAHARICTKISHVMRRCRTQ